jgi:hypothetical protein
MDYGTSFHAFLNSGFGVESRFGRKVVGVYPTIQGLSDWDGLCNLDCCCEKGEGHPAIWNAPPQFVLLPVENVRSFYRFAVGVSAFERLGQHFAVLGNDVLTSLMISPTSLFHFPTRRTGIFPFD